MKQKLLCVSKLNREGNPARHGHVWMGSQCKLPKLVHENCQDYYMPGVICPYFSLSYMGLCSMNSSADNRETDSRAKRFVVQRHRSLAPWYPHWQADTNDCSLLLFSMCHTLENKELGDNLQCQSPQRWKIVSSNWVQWAVSSWQGFKWPSSSEGALDLSSMQMRLMKLFNLKTRWQLNVLSRLRTVYVCNINVELVCICIYMITPTSSSY